MPSPTQPTNQPASKPTLPDGIEIFRAGRHIDDSGDVHEFSEADVAGMVESYSPALREAPLCVGHPKDNLPAYGWVKSIQNSGGVLTMAVQNVEPQFAEMVESRRFPKRSACFYPPGSPNNPTPGKWYLRHVAFLGAQPPAIAGLKDIQFSEGDAEGVVSFSESTTQTTSPEDEIMTKEEIEALQAQLKAEEEARKKAEQEAAQAKKDTEAANAKVASFAEQAKAERKAGFVSFAEAQVKAGRLLPKDKEMAVATLDALADAKPVSFSEGNTTTQVSPAQWLQNLISAAKPMVSFGEFAGGQMQHPGSAAGKSDEEVDKAAKAYMREHQEVSYSEALTAVTATFTS